MLKNVSKNVNAHRTKFTVNNVGGGKKSIL